jgi:hypothetical protein
MQSMSLSAVFKKISSAELDRVLKKIADADDRIASLADEIKAELTISVGCYDPISKTWKNGVTLKDQVDPQSTVGIYDTEGKKWKGIAVNDSLEETDGIGVFDSDSKTWIGGSRKKIQQPLENASVGYWNSEAKTWEGGAIIPEESAGTIGTFDKEKQVWNDSKAEVFKNGAELKKLPPAEYQIAKTGHLCKLEDCPNCIFNAACQYRLAHQK